MRKITVEYTVYDYSELSKEAKQKVKDWHLNNPFRSNDFSDICAEFLSACFPKSDLKTQFSLQYCQGDGLNIYGKLNLKDIASDELAEYLPADQFFYEITDEKMEEVCEANDFVFLEDGSLFSE